MRPEEWARPVGHDRLRDRHRHRAAAAEGRASRRRRLISSGSAPPCRWTGAWLVGGSVRDLLVGRPVADIDVMVDGDPAAAARGLARIGGGSPFPLSERHGAWRVVRRATPSTSRAPAARSSDDLGLRDFTVNAIALPLDGGELLDPHDGRGDLDAGRCVRSSDRIYDDDPLRLLRLVRLAHQLGFAIEPATLDLARARAALADRPSGERIFMELRRLLDEPDPADGLRLLDRVRRAGGGAARAGDDARPGAEPLPPPGRARAHAPGGRRGRRRRGAPRCTT